MAISFNVYEVTDTAVQIVAADFDSQKVWIQNVEPLSDSDEYARAGFIWELSQLFPVAQSGTTTFAITTGSAGLQIEYFAITSDTSNVLAQLVEGTTNTAGASVAAYNTNRNESDTYTSSFATATVATGGSVVNSEFVTADKHSAGGGMTSGKIITLQPSTDYAFRFVNQQNQETNVFLNLGFTEKYNGLNQVWLGSSAGSAVTLRGHEMIQLDLRGGESLTAVSDGGSNTVIVMRQE
jgi:hypothetical protein